MVESVDDTVYKVINYLEKQGFDKETLVIFTSDNGGP
jgi:arylsulfatase A-like enzyme